MWSWLKKWDRKMSVSTLFCIVSDHENVKKKSTGEVASDSDTDETLDVTIDIDDDDATVERDAGDSDGRDTVI